MPVKRPKYKQLYLQARSAYAAEAEQRQAVKGELHRIRKVLAEHGELHVLPELSQADGALISREAPIMLTPLFFECYRALLKMNQRYTAEEDFGRTELLAFRARRVLCR